jgi:hypothetical protein
MARYKYSENTKEVTDIYFDTETHGEFMGMEQGGEMKKVTTARIKEKLMNEIVLGVDWQQEVLTMTSTPPVSPTEGDRYIVGTSATGDWTGYDDYIAEYASGAWVFLAPQSRMGVFSYNDMYFLIYLDGEWQLLATLDEITELRDEVQGYRDEILNDPGFQAVSADLVGDDNIGAVADALAIITAVNNNSTNINAVAGNETNINAVNANKANINAVNANKVNIDAVSNNSTNINTVATNNSNVTTVATSISAVNAVATDLGLGASSLIKIVADNIAYVTSVANNITNVNTVAGLNTEITALGARTTEIDALYAQLSTIAEKENLSNKKSTLSENSEIYYPNQKAVNDGLNLTMAEMMGFAPRNLMDVFGTSTVADTFQALRTYCNQNGPNNTHLDGFRKLRLGDYIDLPSLTMSADSLYGSVYPARTINNDYNRLRVEIVGFDNYYYVGNTAYPSQHHVTMMFKDIPTTAPFNETNTTTGDYPGSMLFHWLHERFEPALISAINGGGNTIQPLAVDRIIGTVADWAWVGSEKIFLPTSVNVFGTTGFSHANYGTGTQTQFALFALNPNRKIKRNNNSRSSWWLAEPSANSSAAFCAAYLGSSNHILAGGTFGVVPAFLI